MLKAIISQEVHGFLYLTCACLLYIFLAPALVGTGLKKKFLFVAILLFLVFSYFGIEELNPLVYMVYTVPLCLGLATEFEGFTPGINTGILFNLFGYYFLGNDFLPCFSASACMFALGMVLYRRKGVSQSIRSKLPFATGMLTLYLAVFFGLEGTHLRENWSTFVYAAVGSYLFTWIVTYLYYNVKYQEVMKERLISAEKYQLVGQMAASISHEIRNPLTTTRGYLQLMKEDKFSADDRYRFITYAIEGIDQANTIITDYLNYAKPNAEGIEEIDLKKEIADTIPLISSLLVIGNIELKVSHLNEGPLIVRGQSNKLKQCLLNLLKNSIEAMSVGGTLTIETEHTNGSIWVSIKDTGVGMTGAQIKLLGMPFFTTKDTGTGLGLMVVKSLLKSMNGKISFISKPDKGTTCLIEFKDGA